MLHKSVYPPFNPMQFKEQSREVFRFFLIVSKFVKDEEEEPEEESEEMDHYPFANNNENNNTKNNKQNFLDVLSAGIMPQTFRDKSPGNISRSS